MILDRPLRAQLAREIGQALAGARVRRVHQPQPDILILVLRGPGGELRLLAAADPRRARVHLTRHKRPNPPSPPPFCMLARKHLIGRPFAEALADEARPVIHIRFGPRPGAGERAGVILTTEMTGHAATVLLAAEENGSKRILGLMRPLPAARRALAPGSPYAPPALGGRLDPARADPREVVETAKRLLSLKKKGRAQGPDRLFSRVFEGVGRRLAAEAVSRAGLRAARTDAALGPADAAALLDSLGELLRAPCRPVLVIDDAGEPVEILPFPLGDADRRIRPVATVSEALDALSLAAESSEGLEGMRQRTLRAIARLIAHRELKLARQRRERQEALGGQRWRREADLLLAQGDAGRRGLDALEVKDTFDPAGPSVTITLNPALTLAENAERRYRRARKAARGVARLGQVIARGEIELRYLQEQQLHAEMAQDEATLAAIEASLRDNVSLVPSRERPKGRRSRSEAIKDEEGPRRFTLEGWELILGRHGRDNDRIVTRIGSGKDYWFHARGLAGAHVLLRRGAKGEPPPTVIEGAARLAAHFSRARAEENADVMVTELRHVKKPRGAPPGQVVVRESRTLRVSPGFPEGLAPLPGSQTGDDRRASGRARPDAKTSRSN